MAAQKQVANEIIKVDTTQSELADYYAAMLFNPKKSILLRAIRNNSLTSWMALTTRLISKHLPKILAAAQGHMDQVFNNLWSTKPLKMTSKKYTVHHSKKIITSKHMMLCAQHSWRRNCNFLSRPPEYRNTS